MPKKFSLAEMRKWLDLYEKGKSEISIAKKAKCDARTVKKGIEQARRERDAHAARAELLKDALRKHHDEFLTVINMLPEAVVMLGPDWMPHRERDAIPQPIRPSKVTANYEREKGWTVTLDVESTPQWKLLQEHLKHDPMRDAIDKWKKALAFAIGARVELKRKIGDLLEEKTGFKLVENPVEQAFLCYYPTVNLFYQVVVYRTLGIPDGPNPESDIVTDDASGEVRIETSRVLARSPGREKECAKNILDALKELQASEEAARVAETYGELEKCTAKALETVEEISLLGLVPGQCRVCRRLGM